MRVGRKPSITFGTSGWRAILGEEFTFDNASLVVRAIADELLASGKGSNGVLVTHDARFLGGRFALAAAEVLAGAGIRPLVTDRDAPTPVASFEIVRRKLDGGINFTASHNPAEYQGMKFSPANGGPASKELTHSLEKRIVAFQNAGSDIPRGKAPPERIDPRPEYRRAISRIVDLAAIKSSGMKILVNCLYGTSRDYLDAIMRDAGCKVEVMNDTLNPSFGGFPPEPAPEYVKDFTSRLDSEDFGLGLATDGDADRFGIFGPGGVQPNANEVIALLVNHLAVSRGWRGKVVRSVATSHFVDRVAALHGSEIVEVPVGFKWIAAEMERSPEEFVIGGEESGGLTIRGHIPEKDGILACLLVAEMIAERKKPLPVLLDELRRRTAPIVSRRVNVHYRPDAKERILAAALRDHRSLAGLKVARKVTIDGTKFILEDGSWIMLRFSGTEPVVRLYVESDPGGIEKVEAAGRALIDDAI